MVLGERLHQSHGIRPQAQAPAGPPMTLGNMRELGVQRLIASCLNDACRHTALIDLSKAEEKHHAIQVICLLYGASRFFAFG